MHATTLTRHLHSVVVLILLLVVSGASPGSSAAGGEDFYELLGVDRGANTKTIRKAFKRLALIRHPDKNPDDPDAHSAFVRINRAYEVLKDEELRKKYDEHGEAGLEADFQSGHSHEYQSWQFYHDNFGIYDDDPEIVTLSRSDFAEEVHESEDLWFINFYSTFCSHCHALAPTWRDFARQMDGIVRVGAVNCAEDPMLCQSQHVMGYPSLVAYPKHAFYHGHRDVDSLIEFIASHITTPVHRVKGRLDASLPSTQLKPWVVEFCREGEDYCLSEMERRKVASLLKDIANFGTADCVHHPKVCSDTFGRSDGLLYFSSRDADAKRDGVEIIYAELKEIYSEVLQLIAPVRTVKEGELRKLVSLDIDREEDTSPIYTFDSLLIFLDKATTEGGDAELAEYKKLEATFPEINVRHVDCSQPTLKHHCDQMNLKSLPSAVLFHAGGVGYDINYSNQPKLTVRDVVKFLRKSLPSSMITLTDESYVETFESDGTTEMWLIDYFAPLRALPRRVEGTDKELRVGTLDCQAHKELCEGVGVGSYPTTILYLNGVSHRSVGFHSADDILEMVAEAINPSVQELTYDSFQQLVANREHGHVYMVDFFAPWCGPCQQLAPEFKKLARQMRLDSAINSTVHFGSVDCDAEKALCEENGVRGYPLVRLYPHKPEQRTRDYPSNWWRDHKSMRQWLNEFLPSLVERVGGEFSSQVLGSLEPVVVDFFAPWCGHCVHFAPFYEQAAKALEGKVRLVKVDCERTPYVCQLAAVQAYPSVRLYTGVAREGERQSPTGIYIDPKPNVERLVSTIGGLLDRHPPPMWKETGRRWSDEL